MKIPRAAERSTGLALGSCERRKSYCANVRDRFLRWISCDGNVISLIIVEEKELVLEKFEEILFFSSMCIYVGYRKDRRRTKEYII